MHSPGALVPVFHRLALAALTCTLLAAQACADNTGNACKTDGDCANDQMCVYEASKGCDATPQCAPKPTGTMCGAIREQCGCHMRIVYSGCGFPNGYVSGPVDDTRHLPLCAGPDASDAPD